MKYLVVASALAFSLGVGVAVAQEDEDRADQCFKRGHESFDRNDLKEAEKLYRQAIELNGKEARYHRQLALLLARMGRAQEADRAVLIAIKLDPLDWRSQLLRAQIYHGQERFEEEEEVYRKVLKLLPQDQAALRKKIEAHLEKQRSAKQKEEERLKKIQEYEQKAFELGY